VASSSSANAVGMSDDAVVKIRARWGVGKLHDDVVLIDCAQNL
jgi:hypothetical protein